MVSTRLVGVLKNQLDHEGHERKLYARRFRETKPNMVKLVYGKLTRFSRRHTEVPNHEVTDLTASQWFGLSFGELCRKRVVEP